MSTFLKRILITTLGVFGLGFLLALAGSPASAAPAGSHSPTMTKAGCTKKCPAPKPKVKGKASVSVAQLGAGAAAGTYSFSLDISPNLAGNKSYKYAIQQLVVENGAQKWKVIGTYRSQGAAESGIHSVGAGTYRIKVWSCKGVSYSASFILPASAGGASGTGTGTSSGTGSAITNIYITQGGSSGTGTGSGTTGGTGTQGGPSGAPTTTTVPGAPTSISATFQAPLTAAINWTAPTSNGGSAILYYRVVDLVRGVGCIVAAPATSCQVPNLIPGGSYSFVVMAQNAIGWSTQSASSNTIVAIEAPSAPLNVAVVRIDGGAIISWTASAYNGGASITRYVVTSSNSLTCIATSETTCTIETGLTNTTAYWFTVQAENAAGMSVASSKFNLAAATVPDPASNVQATIVGRAGSASWSKSTWDGGLGPVTYKVYVGRLMVCSTDKLSCSNFSLTDLETGSYSVTVIATNPVGASAGASGSPFFLN